MRRLTYRHAITAFVFTLCWGVLGFLFLLSPIPGALGIASGLIELWLVMSFVVMAAAGAILTMAAINGLFPPVEHAPPSRPSRPTPLHPADQAAEAKAWTRPLSETGSRPSSRANRR